MEEKILRLESGSYTLEICAHMETQTASVLAYEGGGSRLFIPDAVTVGEKRYPVTAIEKKAFLSNKGLREVSLPVTVTHIGDWAFAQCENLLYFVIRGQEGSTPAGIAQELCFGRGVFDSCHRMENICLGYEEKEDLSALLAAIIYRMPAEYLLKDKDLGTCAWYAKWDQCLSTFLNEPDEDGYTDLVLCGEEDIFYNEPDFAMNKRRKKAALCLLRMRYDKGITEEMKSKFCAYLLSHTKGCPTEEAWEVLLSEFGEMVEYYKLFARLGGIHQDNIDDMLTDMGERFAEAKAFLLNYKQENFSGGDFFSQFQL